MSEGFKEQFIGIQLKKIKEAALKDRILYISRAENMQTMRDLDLSLLDLKKVLCSLTVQDYHRGPEDDHDGSEGAIWIFLHPVSGCLIYIKVKLFRVDGNAFVKVISFHT